MKKLTIKIHRRKPRDSSGKYFCLVAAKQVVKPFFGGTMFIDGLYLSLTYINQTNKTEWISIK